MSPKLRTWLIGSGKLLGFLLALDAFFVAIKLMGAFKSLGAGYGEELIQQLAANPFIGLVIGIMVTSIIQSSSTTTSITVGLVATGALGDDPNRALALAVPIIMGANIGTSVTNTIVSLGHAGNKAEFRRAYSAAVVHDVFNWLAVLVLLPLQVATNFLGRFAVWLAQLLEDTGGLKVASPIDVVIKPQQHLITELFEGSPDAVQFVVIFFLAFGLLQGILILVRRVRAEKNTTIHALALSVGMALVATFVVHFREYMFHHSTAAFLTGLGMLFAALWAIVRIMRSVVLDRVQALFESYIFKTTARALVLGIVITAAVQSSSITTSLIVPLAGAGLLNLNQILPYTLGANIGTTITALLAALSIGEVSGVAAALAHLLFNVLGISIWLPLRRVPIWLAERLAHWASYSAAIPVAIILVAYLGIPLACILIFG